MKNKLKFLTRMSLKKKIGTKWFIAINILLLVIIVAITNIDSIISLFGGDFDKDTTIYVIDNSTNKTYDIFEQTFESTKNLVNSNDKVKTKLTTKSEKEIKDTIKDNTAILLIFNDDSENYINASIVSNSYMDTVLYQTVLAAINTTKSSIAYSKTNIDMEELAKLNSPVVVNRQYIDETKNESEENMETIMSVVFPMIILPFFMLVIFLVQMVGAEINEEKTTRGMEIIISNVSPKVHLFSKIIAANIFVILQALLLFIYGLIGLKTRSLLGSGSITKNMTTIGLNVNDIWSKLVESGFADKLMIIIPLTIVLFILSFVAYSLLAGILASMTTSMEDYQQLQTPIILVCLSGYYLSIMASLFKGAIFIKVASYIPFISALLAPSLLVIGQIGISDILISIFVLIILNYIMLKYGLKIYKVGILNYSSSKLWTKIFKAVKE